VTEILLAGIGNILRGDDGFGVEVVRRIAASGGREGVRVVDFGIRGFDLAFALSSGHRAAILIDAAARGGPPGTLYVLEPHEIGDVQSLDTHAMHPLRALELARALGEVPRTLRVIACEPSSFGDEDVPTMGLSPVVEAAVEQAVLLVDEVLAEVFGQPGREARNA
jgi:hydrogenase maturation protease